jgi:hypothetical protein
VTLVVDQPQAVVALIEGAKIVRFYISKYMPVNRVSDNRQKGYSRDNPTGEQHKKCTQGERNEKIQLSVIEIR